MRKLLVPALMAACLIPAGIAVAGDDPPESPTPAPPTVAPADILAQGNAATASFAQRNFIRILLRGGFSVRGRATLDAPPDTVCRTFVTARIPRGVCLFDIKISDRLRPRPRPWESRSLRGHGNPCTASVRGHGDPCGPPPRPTQPIVVRHFECIGAVHFVLNPNAPLVQPLGVDCIRNPNTVERPTPTPYPGPGPHPYPTPVV